MIKLFAQDPDAAAAVGAAGGDTIKKIPGVVDVLDGIENTISGPALMFNVDPVVAARAGFTPQEVELDASAILQGEPATTPVVAERSRLHHSRALPARDARLAGRHPEHAAVSGTGKTATLGLAGDSRRRFPARPRSAARICSAMCR